MRDIQDGKSGSQLLNSVQSMKLNISITFPEEHRWSSDQEVVLYDWVNLCVNIKVTTKMLGNG